MDSQEELERQSALLMPTSDELLKELPKEIETNGYVYFIDIFVSENIFCVSYKSNSDTLLVETGFENKLSNVLATCWLYLKKEGYIK